MKKLLIIFIILPLFFSCDLFNQKPYEPSGNFWALNFRTSRSYRVNAELIWEGLYCNVWVEKGSGVSEEQARRIADEYDNNIYNKMIENFSLRDFSYQGNQFDNIMDFADWLGDSDGKLCILLLDIKDNFRKGINDSYIAGYFWSGDLFQNTPGLFGSNSNERDMIYIDTNPGMENNKIDDALNTLAHEMQHLMNFVTSIIKRYEIKNSTRYILSMDTWIDEGLSSAAEWVYSGHSQNRIDWYNQNGTSNGRKGLIDQGNNFFVWGNRTKENSYAILDDYATVYLFFQWLRLHGSSDIYKRIITSEFRDHEAVTSEFGMEWNIILKTWLAANYINERDGLFGYKDDLILSNVKVPSAANIGKTLMLAPGEGVYSYADTDPAPSGEGKNIRFAYMTDTLTDSYHVPSVMLTYNINSFFDPVTLNKGPPESGITTGIPIPSASIIPAGRSVFSADSAPYRIGVRDLELGIRN